MVGLTISKEVLDNNNISLDQILVLLMVSNNIDLKKTIDSLLVKGLVDKDVFNKLSLSKKANMLLEKVALDADKNIPPGRELEDLVNKLKSLFPEGKKPGTSLYWRGNYLEIVKKLRVFFKKYKRYSDEEIVDAAKRYVESFNGDYQYMHILKYFILKSVRNFSGEIEEISELASYIENKNQENIKNWETVLI